LEELSYQRLDFDFALDLGSGSDFVPVLDFG